MKLKVENLSCANCAQKIEEEVRALEHVDKVSINLMEEYMIVTGDNINMDVLIKKINKIANRIEPGTKFSIYERKETEIKNDYAST